MSAKFLHDLLKYHVKQSRIYDKTDRTCGKVSTGKFDCSVKGTATLPSMSFVCSESRGSNGIATLVFPAADISQAGWPIENGLKALPNAMGA